MTKEAAGPIRDLLAFLLARAKQGGKGLLNEFHLGRRTRLPERYSKQAPQSAIVAQPFAGKKSPFSGEPSMDAESPVMSTLRRLAYRAGASPGATAGKYVGAPAGVAGLGALGAHLTPDEIENYPFDGKSAAYRMGKAASTTLIT